MLRMLSLFEIPLEILLLERMSQEDVNIANHTIFYFPCVTIIIFTALLAAVLLVSVTKLANDSFTNDIVVIAS